MDALANNRLSYGPYSKRFEREFADVHGKKYACFVNSGTDALRIGLGAMKEKFRWRDGAGVLVPALTFVSSLNVIVQNNLRPILVDIDPVYFDMLPHYPSDGEVAAMPVSLFGQPHGWRQNYGVAYQWLPAIEDSCETMFMGTSSAEVACYSSYACHLINTGVGGFALTDDAELATIIRSLANHGRSGIYTGIDQVLGQTQVMDARFKFERLGYSARATEMEAAIGCAELEDREPNILTRRRNAKYLGSALAGFPLQLPMEREVGRHAYMMYPIVCKDGVGRDELTRHLEEQGIETRHMVPLTNQPYIKTLFGHDVEDRFPNAKRVNERGFYIGCHQHLTELDMSRIVGAFRDFFGD